MQQHNWKYFYGLFLVVCLGATAEIGWAQQSLPPSQSLVGRHFGIDHGLMWRPEHYALVKEMDVIPSVYAKAMYGNDNLVEMYGMDRVYEMQPVKSMIEAGIRPAAEADALIWETTCSRSSGPRSRWWMAPPTTGRLTPVKPK